MATEEKINSEEQLQEENITTQTEETQQEAEQQDAAKNSAEDAAETPEVEIDPLEAAQAEIAELKKQILYKVAEFDNYRKRVIKEKADLILNGGEKVITAILPVVDDMERALEQMRKAEDVQAVVEGVELIQKKFMGILEKQGVKAIETKDADFDVEVHEAIAQFPAPSEELKNKVVDCTLKGYKLNEKVIRHAQVVVGI
ncbi:MAG: nucleotide exchange factor GrpE [Bacteroidaceae bacterium]|nr:nucleotide exchange factor GrpE [Bacteroidaceae bacterium]